MPAWMAGASLVGGLFGASSAKSAAKTQADAAVRAAQIQADAAKLKPSSVSTGFGTGDIRLEGDKGIGSYTLDPRLAGIRDILYGAGTGMMPSQGTQQFYGDVQQQAQQRAMQAMGMSPEAAATKEYESLLGMMAPQRARDQAGLAQNLFKTGRMGAGVSYGGTGGAAGYINPEQFAYMKALEEQNQGMAMNSLDRSRQQQTQDIQNYFNLAGQAPAALAGIYGQGSSLFKQGTGYEQLGMGALEGAAGLAGRTTAASGQAGQYLGQGMNTAAGFQAAGAQAYPLAISKAFNTLGSRPITGQDPTTGQFTYGSSPAQQFGNWAGSLFSGSPSQNTGSDYWKSQNYGNPTTGELY